MGTTQGQVARLSSGGSSRILFSPTVSTSTLILHRERRKPALPLSSLKTTTSISASCFYQQAQRRLISPVDPALATRVERKRGSLFLTSDLGLNHTYLFPILWWCPSPRPGLERRCGLRLARRITRTIRSLQDRRGRGQRYRLLLTCRMSL